MTSPKADYSLDAPPVIRNLSLLGVAFIVVGILLHVFDHTFDAVVSSLAIHNVPTAHGREEAIREVARVLKPGDQLMLLDFQGVGAHAQMLRDMGWGVVDVSRPIFLMFPPTRVLRAKKPA